MAMAIPAYVFPVTLYRRTKFPHQAHSASTKERHYHICRQQPQKEQIRRLPVCKWC